MTLWWLPRLVGGLEVFYDFFTRLLRSIKEIPERSCSLPARTNVTEDHFQSCFPVRGAAGLICLGTAPTSNVGNGALFSSSSFRPAQDGAHPWNGIFCRIYSKHGELFLLFLVSCEGFFVFKEELNSSSAARH